MHAAALQALETVLETSASDCEFSLTNESVLFRYCRDLIALIGAMPLAPTLFRLQLLCLCHCCSLTSLLVIDTLPLLVSFMNTHVPSPLSEEQAETAASLQCLIFNVFMEMRDINRPFSVILSHSEVAQLSDIYTRPAVTQCLERLARQILPLQVSSVLSCLYPFILDSRYGFRPSLPQPSVRGARRPYVSALSAAFLHHQRN